jgi:hypothetical protein
MTASAFDPKPDDIPTIFRDRIDVHDAVIAVVWPTRVQTKKVARVVRTTNNRRCDYARVRVRSNFPRDARMDRARIARAHHLWSKAIFPPIWSSGIRSSMPSSVCSVAPWTTFSRAPDANNVRREAGLP